MLPGSALLRSDDGSQSWECDQDWPRECMYNVQFFGDATVVCWLLQRHEGRANCDLVFNREIVAQRSDDGGNSWHPIRPPSGVWPYGMWWRSADEGFVSLLVELEPGMSDRQDWPGCVVDLTEQQARRAILVTRDGGISWSEWSADPQQVDMIRRNMQCDVPAERAEDWIAADFPSR